MSASVLATRASFPVAWHPSWGLSMVGMMRVGSDHGLGHHLPLASSARVRTCTWGTSSALRNYWHPTWKGSELLYIYKKNTTLRQEIYCDDCPGENNSNESLLLYLTKCEALLSDPPLAAHLMPLYILRPVQVDLRLQIRLQIFSRVQIQLRRSLQNTDSATCTCSLFCVDLEVCMEAFSLAKALLGLKRPGHEHVTDPLPCFTPHHSLYVQ